jgi:hypothetical protein
MSKTKYRIVVVMGPHLSTIERNSSKSIDEIQSEYHERLKTGEPLQLQINDEARMSIIPGPGLIVQVWTAEEHDRQIQRQRFMQQSTQMPGGGHG